MSQLMVMMADDPGIGDLNDEEPSFKNAAQAQHAANLSAAANENLDVLDSQANNNLDEADKDLADAKDALTDAEQKLAESKGKHVERLEIYWMKPN